MDEQDDVTIEPENNNGEERTEDAGLLEEKMRKLREELSACRKEKQEYMDGWQRSKADYVNLLKRMEQEAGGRRQEGLLHAVKTLLPAFDAIERAKQHLEVELPSNAGFMAIAKQLESAFVALGLEPIGAAGEKFNPVLHEAFGRDATQSEKEDDTVTAVLEKGWRIGEHIIRPAKVRVAHFASE